MIVKFYGEVTEQFSKDLAEALRRLKVLKEPMTIECIGDPNNFNQEELEATLIKVKNEIEMIENPS